MTENECPFVKHSVPEFKKDSPHWCGLFFKCDTYWYNIEFDSTPFIRKLDTGKYDIFPYAETEDNERYFDPIPFDTFEEAFNYYVLKFC